MNKRRAKPDLAQVAGRLTACLGTPAATDEGFQWLLEQEGDQGPSRIRVRLDGVGGLTTLDLSEERADGHDTVISLVIQSLAQLDRTIHALDGVRSGTSESLPRVHEPATRPLQHPRSEPRRPGSD
jgi:hypothetical protein